jgi:phosphate-selective porin OprO/OprP
MGSTIMAWRNPAAQCLAVLLLFGSVAAAQTPVVARNEPTPPRAGSVATAAKPTERATPPSAEADPASPADATPPNREAALESRIEQLESLVRELSGRLERFEQIPPTPGASAPSGARRDIGAQVGGSAAAAGPLDIPGSSGGAAMPGAVAGPGPAAPGTAGVRSDIGAEVGGSAATAGPLATPTTRFNMPHEFPKRSAKSFFSHGFEITTDDDEFSFQFHDLTQVDYRGYEDTPTIIGAEEFRSTFGIPRQWWIFSGRLTKPFEYYVVPAFGFDNVNLLDVFLNVHFDDRAQFKIGRYKTPFTYEFYNLPINGLVNPERSLFFNNIALNRDLGAMFWGQMFEKRFDYALGAFNGQRNFFADRNSNPMFAGLLNFRPFGKWKDSPLEFLNFGGSVMAGNEAEAPVPRVYRTNVATTGSGFFGVPFFAYNTDVVEQGPRIFWDMHAAWYYRHLSLIAEWASGFQDYAHLATAAFRTRIPTSGYYIQAGYFLTGETVSARGVLNPIRNFDLRPGKLGLGAIELASRYSTLSLGPEVFTRGLADPNLWTRNAYLIDVGFNWYWSSAVKVYLGWQHAGFASPVILEPGRYQLTNDMYWVRFQVFF